MDIGNVISRAWQIIWKYKILWIFGILASCTGGGNSGLSYTFNGSDFGNAGVMPPLFNYEWSNFWGAFPWILLIVLISIALVILIVFLSTIGRIGLIRGVVQAEEGADRLSFKKLFSGSTPYFWRMFGLNLLVGLLIILFVIVFAVFAVIGSVLTLGLLVLCLIPVICLMVPAFWALNLVLEQAYNAIVIENRGILDGLSRGWAIFKNNLGTMIGMGLLLLVIGVVGGIIIGVGIVIIASPWFFAVSPGMDRPIWIVLPIFLTCLVVLLPILLLFGGILRSFTSAAWTLTFLRLTKTPGAAITSFSPTPSYIGPELSGSLEPTGSMEPSITEPPVTPEPPAEPTS